MLAPRSLCRTFERSVHGLGTTGELQDRIHNSRERAGCFDAALHRLRAVMVCMQLAQVGRQWHRA